MAEKKDKHRYVPLFTGRHFGALEVTCWARRTRGQSRGFSWLYLCLCECGETVYVLANALNDGSRDRCSADCEPGRIHVLAKHRARHGVDPKALDELIEQDKGLFK